MKKYVAEMIGTMVLVLMGCGSAVIAGAEIGFLGIAFAFGLSAQIERDLISQRTKEGLARRKASGQQLGRKKGDKNTHYKLTGKENIIRTMLDYGYSKAAICRKLKCNFKTLDDHLERMNEKPCDLEDN